MTKALIERVVDTRKYRYILDDVVGKTPCIKRLPIMNIGIRHIPL